MEQEAGGGTGCLSGRPRLHGAVLGRGPTQGESQDFHALPARGTGCPAPGQHQNYH